MNTSKSLIRDCPQIIVFIISRLRDDDVQDCFINVTCCCCCVPFDVSPLTTVTHNKIIPVCSKNGPLPPVFHPHLYILLMFQFVL
ncbi:hypothetical protein LSH36_1881g00016, partial [Paralvinella palmiformis]